MTRTEAEQLQPGDIVRYTFNEGVNGTYMVVLEQTPQGTVLECVYTNTYEIGQRWYLSTPSFYVVCSPGASHD